MALPTPINVTSFSDWFALANTNTGGWFWAGSLVLIFIVVLFALLHYGEEVAGLTASFVAFILGLWLTYAELVAWYVTTFFLGITIFLMLYIAFGRRGSES